MAVKPSAARTAAEQAGTIPRITPGTPGASRPLEPVDLEPGDVAAAMLECGHTARSAEFVQNQATAGLCTVSRSGREIKISPVEQPKRRKAKPKKDA